MASRAQSAPAASVQPDLVDAVARGERRALARLITLLESEDPRGHAALQALHSRLGRAHVIGVTGAPGTGKSTLVDRLIEHYRRQGKSVGVVAVDPSSPFTGGAILGDRIRMQGHAVDGGVFIRSMATRGHLGGLAMATRESIRVLDAVGFPLVLLETVGVGQVEVEVAGAADTTVVVLNPGWGDGVQAAKAGLLEIADVFAINKADRPGVEEATRDLEHMLDLVAPADGAWRPPIVPVIAATGEGIDALWAHIEAHRAWQAGSDRLERRRRARLADELDQLLVARLLERARAAGDGAELERLRDEVVARRLDPWSAVDALLGAEHG